MNLFTSLAEKIRDECFYSKLSKIEQLFWRNFVEIFSPTIVMKANCNLFTVNILVLLIHSLNYFRISTDKSFAKCFSYIKKKFKFFLLKKKLTSFKVGISESKRNSLFPLPTLCLICAYGPANKHRGLDRKSKIPVPSWRDLETKGTS